MAAGVLRQVILLLITMGTSLIYIASSHIKHVWGWLFPWRWRERRLLRRLSHAESYQEWEKTALEIDELHKNNFWKLDPEAPKYYDAKGIQQRLCRLRQYRTEGDFATLMLVLPELLTRNLCGLGNLGLYRHCTVGTKILIEEYIEEVVHSIHDIAYSGDCLPTEKVEFLSRSVQAYGRTALLFSGGLSFGMYHWGVIKCLFEENLLPQVVCGSSIGALFAALLGIHSDAQLSAMFDDMNAIDLSPFERLGPKGWKRKLFRLFTQDVLMDVTILEEFCRTNLGDYTFDEAYRKTGRIVNIVLTHTTHTGYPSLLNYRTAPNVLLWSAASASCAQPGLYAPLPLYAKDMNGSVIMLHEEHVAESWAPRTVHHSQLPMQQLRENFNVNHLIVSQVNPHVIPLLRSLHSSSRENILHRIAVLLGEEIVHRIRQFLQFGYLAKPFAWLRSDLLQPAEGNITIIPPLSMSSLRRVVANPNRGDVIYFRREGERSVYPYLAIIRNRCRIEMALNTCLREAQHMAYVTHHLAGAWKQVSPEPSSTRALRSPIPATPTTKDHIPPRRREAPPRSPTDVPSPRQSARPHSISVPENATLLTLQDKSGYQSAEDDQDAHKISLSQLSERLLQTSFTLSPSTDRSIGNTIKSTFQPHHLGSHKQHLHHRTQPMLQHAAAKQNHALEFAKRLSLPTRPVSASKAGNNGQDWFVPLTSQRLGDESVTGHNNTDASKGPSNHLTVDDDLSEDGTEFSLRSQLSLD